MTYLREPLDTHAACTACPIVSGRRAFLRDAARLASVAALAAVGAPVSVAGALAAVPANGRRDAGNTVSYPIPTGDGAQIDRDNQVILVHWQKAVYAFALSCPHQNTALRWDGSDNRFQCPKHHSKYQPDGTFIEGRATRNMDRFAIKRDGDKVAVDLDTFYKSSEDQAGWNLAVLQLDK
jgi:nitrite reductase/ring-hydroxylating ferredoxin subunit